MTDLRDAVDAAKQRGSSVATRRQTTAFDNVRRNADVLRIIGLDPADPKSHAVVAVCDRYGLDPVLGHIMILGNSRLPYVTRDGFLHIAHRSGQLDGIEVQDPHREGAAWVTHASVWRKDMSRAFTYPGAADVGRDNGAEMAIARAERRALKRAFAVTLPREFAEDEWDVREQPEPRTSDQGKEADTPGTSPGGSIPDSPPGEATSTAQTVPDEDYPDDYWDQPAPAKLVGQIHTTLRELNITERQSRLATLSELVGRPIKSTKELTLGEAETVLMHLRDRQHATVEGDEEDQDEGDDDDT